MRSRPPWRRAEAVEALRVVHVSVVHSLDDPRILERECHTLAGAGHAVWYAGVGDRRPQEAGDVRLVPRARHPRRWRFLTTAQALRTVRAVQPHVVHLHDPELLLALPALRRSAGSVVYDMHEYLSHSVGAKPYIPASLRPATSAVVLRAQRRLGGAVDALVAVTAEQFADMGPRPALRLALPNYPRLSRFNGAVPTLPREDERLRLVHIGTLSPSRGTRLMLEVMRRAGAQAELLLGGRCTTAEFEAELRAAAAAMPHAAVRLLGPVAPAAVPGYLASADVVWLPELPTPQYRRPTIPTKLLEGMAVGLAALVSDLPGRAELVGSEACGVVVPPTADGHLTAICALAKERGAVTACGHRAAAAVVARYSWESVQGSLIDFYARLG